MKSEQLGYDKTICNESVYDFLAEECKQTSSLWKEFGLGILSHSTDIDFWQKLSEHLDCFRVCDECGRPMIEGYVVDGCETYCSDDCLHRHITDEEFNSLYGDGSGDTYRTTWYEDSMTFTKLKNDRKTIY